MRIALDATYSIGPHLSGVGVYSREILHGLCEQHPEAVYYFSYRPHRLLKSFQVPLPKGAHRRLLLEWGMPGRAQLFHGLNQRTPAHRLRRCVTTFHDLFVLTSEYSTPEFRARFAAQARQAAANSDLIICVSAFTARHVESLLQVPSDRLRVVHHGVHQPAQVPKVVGREPMVLCVGALQKRKNMHRLIAAFERTKPGWRLVLAGSSGFGAEEILQQISNSPRRADIQVTGYVDNARLQALYGRAALFAFPSLDEGFGIPVLEAMAWGIPVITSDRSALPEVAGEAALLVNPDDVDELVHNLQTAMDSTGLRQTLAQLGRERAAGFTWAKAVERTWAVYQELLLR